MGNKKNASTNVSSSKSKKHRGFVEKLKASPINYFSDLFIVAMVLLWIIDNVYQTIIASAVTLSSIWLSIQNGYSCYETSMWSSIGNSIAIPLSCGGAIWMIKNSVQHAIANKAGKQAHKDFPRVDADLNESESPMMFQEEDDAENEITNDDGTKG